jgi:hypothetical protein
VVVGLQAEEFVFMLTNPYNIHPRRFASKREMADQVIGRDSACGPSFGDFHISDNCNGNHDSFVPCGWFYINNTGQGSDFFTGSYNFEVEEIEVIEITD